jgi:hypothetical protein
MSNGTQTVVREPYHRIGVLEKSSERCLGYIQFCNEAGLRIWWDGGSILSKRKEFFLSYRIRTGPTTNAASHAMATGWGTICTGIKRPKHVNDLPAPNVRTGTNTKPPPPPPHTHTHTHTQCGIKHSNTFALTIPVRWNPNSDP